MAAKFEILNKNSFYLMEWIYWLYQPPAYQQLEGLLKKNILKKGEDFVYNSRIMIICFGFGFFLLIYIAWLPIFKAIRKEREMLRLAFRVIPIGIIMHNRHVKQYLMNNSGGVLSAVRNVI
jgi:hypothetical protein